MLISVFFSGVLMTMAGDNPAYDAQLDPLVGQSYREAVELLGMPVSRSLREGGGEVWIFRYDSRVRRQDNSDTHYGPDGVYRPVDHDQGSRHYQHPATGQDSASGGGSSGTGSADPEGSTSTGAGLTATRAEQVRICVTRIGLDPDGTIAEYTYQGDCFPVR